MTYVSDIVIGMQEKLSYTALASALSVMTAMWMLKDAIAPSLAAPKLWAYHRWLRLRGMEDYVGRHR